MDMLDDEEDPLPLLMCTLWAETSVTIKDVTGSVIGTLAPLATDDEMYALLYFLTSTDVCPGLSAATVGKYCRPQFGQPWVVHASKRSTRCDTLVVDTLPIAPPLLNLNVLASLGIGFMHTRSLLPRRRGR
jgi:hypothetical protein